MLQYNVTVQCYSTVLQYIVAMHCYSTVLQYRHIEYLEPDIKNTPNICYEQYINTSPQHIGCRNMKKQLLGVNFHTVALRSVIESSGTVSTQVIINFFV